MNPNKPQQLAPERLKHALTIATVPNINTWKEIDLLSLIFQLQNVQERHPPRAIEWQLASACLAPLFAEMARRSAIYDQRVRALEAQGLTRSDAQGVVDAQEMPSNAERDAPRELLQLLLTSLDDARNELADLNQSECDEGALINRLDAVLETARAAGVQS